MICPNYTKILCSRLCDGKDIPMSNTIYISGLCPYCPAELDYAEGQKAVVCHCCNTAVPTRLLRPLNSKESAADETEEGRKIAENVTSASLGLIYLDNFCDSFDWREYAHTSDISLKVLDGISEISSLKFSSDPLTYLLSFRCTVIPVLKKIEGLELIEVEIIDNYNSDDISDAFEYTDLYCDITHAIVRSRDTIIAKLEKDVSLAKKFGIDAKIAADLDKSLAVFREKVLAISPASGIEDIPGYKKAKEMRDGKFAENYRIAKGFDAEKTYEKALRLIDEGNVDSALHLLRDINGYKDAEKLIARHSTIFKFNDELFEMAGKCYFVRDEVSYFNVSADKPEDAAEKTKRLYEIVNNVPTVTPQLTGISQIIYSYGSKIFFLRGGVSICAYETKNPNAHANVKVLDEAPRGDDFIGSQSDIFYSADKSKFFVKKKLRISADTKRGCFGKKKKQSGPKMNRENNYSVVLIDMDASTAKTILPEIVDIMDFYNNKIFYTKVNADSTTAFRVYDIESGEDKDILNANCIIHNVEGDKIIYSRWAPTKYNLDLYTVSISTKEEVLIDTNVSGYYATLGGRVFYTVGEGECSRLYSAELSGGTPAEVMEAPGSVCAISSGWIYYVSGEGRNSCLMKVRANGEGVSLVASKFKKLVKMLGGYVYYISTASELCVVRSDGEDGKIIASNVSDEDIIIDKANIYYLKRDRVRDASDTNDGYGLSLYVTDGGGKKLRKLAHDVIAMTDYDDEYIYICKERLNYYRIETPIDKNNYKSEIITKTVTYYETYNKLTGKFGEIVHIGAPTKETASYKTGCFLRKKTITKESIITELRADYKRTGVAESGLIKSEEEAAKQRDEAENQSKKNKKNKADNTESKAKAEVNDTEADGNNEE